MNELEYLKQEQCRLNKRLAEIAEEIEDIMATKINLDDIKPGTRVVYSKGTEVMTLVYDTLNEKFNLGGVRGNPFELYRAKWRTRDELFDHLKYEHKLVK